MLPGNNRHSKTQPATHPRSDSNPNPASPIFSVVVPAYNVAKYLPECIKSVFAQTLLESNEHQSPLIELILVDDGSTDRTGAICDQYAKAYQNYPKEEPSKNQPHPSIISQIDKKVNIKSLQSPQNLSIQVIHQPNQGLSAARNTGIAEANGEYLILLDGDDYLEPDALETIYNHLEPGLDLLRYQAQEVFSDGRKIRHEEAGFATTSGIAAFQKMTNYYYLENAWLYAYRREFFRKNHFQYANGCLAEDFGLTPLIIARASRIKSISDICYDYRQRDGSIMHDSTKLSKRTSDIARQLEDLLPEIATIPHTAPILHYLVVSFLTGATELSHADFLKTYQNAKKSGLLQYIHPSSFKSLPRAFILKHFPNLFYRVYRH